MKRNRIVLGVLVFAAIFMVLAAPATATEDRMFLDLDNSVSDGTPVQVAIYTDINETTQAMAASFDIVYDTSCIQDFPSFDATGSGWVAAGSGAAATCSTPSPGVLRFSSSVGMNDPIDGHVLFGTLTFTCNTTCGGSALTFTNNPKYTDGTMGTVYPTLDHGTFLCNDPSDPIMTVAKKVWDESTSSWVDAIGPLGSEWMDKDVRFNITVTAGCLDLSGVVVDDAMGVGLEYNNSAVPTADSYTTHTANWAIGALTAGTSQSIEFNATIAGYGTNCNTATVTGTVTSLGADAPAVSDAACVTTMPPAGINVTKTVWDESTSSWVDMVTDATIGDTYRFRCEMHNSGSPGMDLTSIVALDVLSDSLEYAGDAKIQTPNGVWRDINPPDINDPANNTVGWTIDSFLQDPLTLQPCQTVVIEFDATVVDYGYDCNNQIATAWCEAAASEVEGNDTACIDTPKPDLGVTAITVNYDASGVKNYAMGPLPPGTKTQSNNISADITELNGIDVLFPFDVKFEIGGVTVHTVSVSGLAAGATTTVYCDNQFFPIAGVTYTITVTADSVDVIPETDEGNNDMDKILTAQVNGYKGDGWQDGRGITNLQCHEQGTINLVYSTGDSAMYSAYYDGPWTTYTANWTTGDFGIPVTDSCIKKARLYVYYNYDKETDGDPTNATDGYYFNLTFNGIEQEVDQHYSDRKSFASYDYPYGMIAYDVADRFMVTDDNHAELTYAWPTGSFKDNSIAGMLLVVVYNNTETEPDRIIWINEGYDSLYARESYGVSSEEATTYAEFGVCGEPIPMDEVVGATLVTVAPHANEGGEKNKLTFNDGEWYGVWDSSTYDGATELGIAETDVRTHLQSTDNTAAFQSHKSGIHECEPYPYKSDRGDSMEASNAFLIVQKGRVEMTVEPEDPASGVCYEVGEPFDVLINIDPMGDAIRGAQFDLHYNGSVIMVDNFELGGFLLPSVSIGHQSIDNSEDGVASFAASTTGGTGGATTSGTFVIVHCMAMGQGATSELNLTGVVVYDDTTPIMQPVPADVVNSSVEVCNNAPPVAVPSSVFKYNNMADKVLSKAYFDGTASDDTDGVITMYEWWLGDGATGVGPTTEHAFNVRQYWEGGTPLQGGHYIPANVTLIVTDDGMPLMDGMAHIEVIVWIGGDANGDGVVNIGDSVMVGYYWGGDSHANEYADRADLNNDGIVNIGDSIPVGFCWGHTAW